MLWNLLADIRYSVRGFAQRPTFAAVIVLTLAFGIGVNVAIFSIFEGLLLRPLPVSEPERLVNLVAPGPKPGNTSCNSAGDCNSVFSYPMFRDLERVQKPFVGIAAHRLLDANLAFGEQTLSGYAAVVSGSYFPLLGIQPALGRLLGSQDDRVDGEAEAAVVSYAYWQNRLGSDPSIVGQTLVVNGKPLTIVGVAPRGFHGTTLVVRPSVYVPITFRWLAQPNSLPNHSDRRSYWTYLIARLKPGISLEQAKTAIDPAYQALLNDVEVPLQTGLSDEILERFRNKTLTLTPGVRGQSNVPAFARVPMTILLVVTGIVLLITCVNVANLMLARGSERVAEMAVRISLGAHPRRLMFLLLVESSLLGLAAAALSLPMTLALLRGIVTIVPAEGADTIELGLSAQMVLLSVGAGLLATLVFALFPVLKLALTEPAHALQGQGPRSTGGKAARRFRTGLVTTQIALSMALLVLAGLFTQSLANIARLDLGIRVESLVAFAIAPELNGYEPSRSAILFDRLEEELAALPGVTAATSSLVTLLTNISQSRSVAVEGFEAEPGVNNDVDLNWIGSGFFRAMEIPLLAGRDFSEADSLDRPNVAIVNQRFVERFALGEDAIGTRLALGDGALDIEIVGVARDAKYRQVKETIGPQVFRPRRQSRTLGNMTFYVRADGDPEQVLTLIPPVVAGFDPNLPAVNLRTVNQQVRENVFLDRFVTTLTAFLAVLATLLAAVGLYGVLSYMVAQRTREIGLRLALGADPSRLRGMVLRQVASMGVIGGAIGLSLALLLGLAASALLFGLRPTDASTLLAATLVLAAVVFVAGYLPARRASRIDPIVALRCE